jgi:hypothetical protein
VFLDVLLVGDYSDDRSLGGQGATKEMADQLIESENEIDEEKQEYGDKTPTNKGRIKERWRR